MEVRDRWLYGWALGYTAVGAASLLIPLYALSLGGGSLAVGILASTAAFAGVPGAILWGWLASKTGRRRIFVWVALIATAGVLAAVPSIQSLWVLVLANALLWFVMAAAAPVLNLLVVDGTPEAGWEGRIALLNTFQGYGWVAGLVLGATWIPVATRVLGGAAARSSLFWVCAAAAMTGVGVTSRWLPQETEVTTEDLVASPSLLAQRLRGAGRYVRTIPFATTRLSWGLWSIGPGRLRSILPRTLWIYLAAVTIFSAGFAAFWGPLPAYLGGNGSDGLVFGLYLATNIASTLFYGRVGSWSAHRGSAVLQQRALAVRVLIFPLVGGLALFVPPIATLPLLFVIFVLIGLTWAVIAVTATGLVTRLAGDAKGEALGIYTAVVGIGSGIGSVAGGTLASELSYLVAFSVAGGTVLIGLLVMVSLRLRVGSSDT